MSPETEQPAFLWNEGGQPPFASLRLETLYEQPGLPAFGVPAPLAERYGGDLGFQLPSLYANFVSSLDGVVALDDETPPAAISGHNEADRFVMGLLRACADTILIGASTLRAEPKHLWTPGAVFPAMAETFSHLRRGLGLPDSPQLVVLTRSGDLDPSIPAIEKGALIVTTDEGRDHLKPNLPAASAIVSRGESVDVGEVVEILRREGCRSILCEGGPHVLGELIGAEALDELFLTLSPVLLGRDYATTRLGIVEGLSLDPAALRQASLLSVKKDASHLFLRYRLAF
ncbi:MAG: dihydrofolate reductase family protein [Actinomycetota bacterium]|nr:dihydrofolate reductase family protein [Actinomycetota bacterium]